MINQIKAGAEAIQIFESHAEIALKENKFKKYCIEPNKNIIRKIKRKYPSIPIIGFPRNAGNLYTDYVKTTNIDCLSIDQNVNIADLLNNLKKKKVRNLCLQGNLSPEILLKGGKPVDR